MICTATLADFRKKSKVKLLNQIKPKRKRGWYATFLPTFNAGAVSLVNQWFINIRAYYFKSVLQ